MGIFKKLSDISINYSDFLGTQIVDEKGKRFGKLTDFFVDYEEVYPTILAIQYKRNRQVFYQDFSNIKEFGYKKIIIKNETYEGRSRTYPRPPDTNTKKGLLSSQYSLSTQELPGLGKIVLDKQIVDTNGKKVVRVNDIQFVRVGQTLKVTHAAVGLRSMLRRLGYIKIIDKSIGLVFPKLKLFKKEILINWKYVHAIPNRSIRSDVKLNLGNEDIKNLRPADLADILEDLDGHGRDIIFKNLDAKTKAETLSEVEEDIQLHLLSSESPEQAAAIIEHMDADDAADLLHEMGETKADVIISKISDDEMQEDIQELLEYDEDRAGGLMSTEFFEVKPETTKTQILKYIEEHEQDLESVYDIYIVDKNEKLLGTCTLRFLLSHSHDFPIGDIMTTEDILSLSPQEHWKSVARFMSKYDLINVPIINAENKLLGSIAVDDLLPWLLYEKKS